jgi:hypothetical protein
LHGLLLLLFGGVAVPGISAELRYGFPVKLRTPVECLTARKHRTGKCKTGLFTTLAAIGFIEQLKDFHGISGRWHAADSLSLI